MYDSVLGKVNLAMLSFLFREKIYSDLSYKFKND